MTHTDGYFQAAMDNAAGMASALEIARFYAQKPVQERPRTMKFIQFPDHHHGEVARGRKDVGIDATYPWDKVAVKLTMEHPSQTLLYMYNDGLTPTNAIGAFRWNALGSPEFEQMVFDTLREFGVSVYAQEDGPEERQLRAVLPHHRSRHLPHVARRAGAGPGQRPGALDARVRRRARSGERDDDGAAARRELSAKGRVRDADSVDPQSTVE